MEKTYEKIQMKTPLVEMDGDEMTRILWRMIKDELILPFVELKTEIGRLAKIQKWQIEELRKRGANVRVLKGMDQVLAFLEEVKTNAVYTP